MIKSFIGFAGILWFVAWLLLAFDTPASHPRISPEEQHYIESAIGAELLAKKSAFSQVFCIVFSCLFTECTNRIHPLPGKPFSHHQLF